MLLERKDRNISHHFFIKPLWIHSKRTQIQKVILYSKTGFKVRCKDIILNEFNFWRIFVFLSTELSQFSSCSKCILACHELGSLLPLSWERVVFSVKIYKLFWPLLMKSDLSKYNLKSNFFQGIEECHLQRYYCPFSLERSRGKRERTIRKEFQLFASPFCINFLSKNRHLEFIKNKLSIYQV